MMYCQSSEERMWTAKESSPLASLFFLQLYPPPAGGETSVSLPPLDSQL